MNIPLNPEMQNQVRFVRPEVWQEIADVWRQNEESNAASVYTQLAPPDWLEWRNKIIVPLHLERLDWGLCTIPNPTVTIPYFHGGPFAPWEKRYYGGKQTPTFKEIIAVAGTHIETRDKFTEILASAAPIHLIGLIKDGEIYIVEGMHRCVAIALAASQQRHIQSEARISLAVSDLSYFPTI